MKKKFFGTDGIRGRVGELPMTPDFILKLGRAAGEALIETTKNNKIIIGLKPKVMAFVGKRSAKVFYNMKFGLKNMNYGHQNKFIGQTALYVLPSPSGLANRYWDTEPWQDLAQSLKNNLSY